MRRLAAAVTLALLSVPRAALAEPQPGATESVRVPDRPASKQPAPPATSASSDLFDDELFEREPGEEDLEWLYSNSDEYQPSELGGRSVPVPSLPRRGQGERRAWDPSWRRFGFADYLITGTSLALTGVGAAWPAGTRHWTQHDAFDEAVRRRLGAKTYSGSIIAQDVSDLLLSVSIAYPALFQALVVTYWYRRSEDVAAQMLLITLESVSVTAGIQGMTSALVSRERPYARNCGGRLPSALDDCASSRRYRSFFSGHTSTSFAAAATACSFQFHHDVFANGAANGVACAAALATAATVGTLRVAGDQHYASDVLTGAAVGLVSGFGVPWLLHYGPLARVERESARTTGITFSLVPVTGGLGLGGQF